MIDLKAILSQFPNCLNSRASFKSILMDQYPTEKRMVNILTTLYECGVANRIKAKKSIDANEMQMFITQVENEYGISGQYSQEAMLVWAAAFDVTTSSIKNPVPIKPEQHTEQGSVSDLLLWASQPRKPNPIVMYLMCDCSWDMCGQKIGMTNYALQALIPDLRELSSEYFSWHHELYIQVIESSSQPRILFDSPISIDKFEWNNLTAKRGIDTGAAFSILQQEISKNNELSIVVLLKGSIYESEFNRRMEYFCQSKSVRDALRIAVAIGANERQNEWQLKQFTKNPELVLTMETVHRIPQIINHAYNWMMDGPYEPGEWNWGSDDSENHSTTEPICIEITGSDPNDW